jgi:hypothetical protein
MTTALENAKIKAAASALNVPNVDGTLQFCEHAMAGCMSDADVPFVTDKSVEELEAKYPGMAAMLRHAALMHGALRLEKPNPPTVQSRVRVAAKEAAVSLEQKEPATAWLMLQKSPASHRNLCEAVAMFRDGLVARKQQNEDTKKDGDTDKKPLVSDSQIELFARDKEKRERENKKIESEEENKISEKTKWVAFVEALIGSRMKPHVVKSCIKLMSSWLAQGVHVDPVLMARLFHWTRTDAGAGQAAWTARKASLLSRLLADIINILEAKKEGLLAAAHDLAQKVAMLQIGAGDYVEFPATWLEGPNRKVLTGFLFDVSVLSTAIAVVTGNMQLEQQFIAFDRAFDLAFKGHFSLARRDMLYAEAQNDQSSELERAMAAAGEGSSTKTLEAMATTAGQLAVNSSLLPICNTQIAVTYGVKIKDADRDRVFSAGLYADAKTSEAQHAGSGSGGQTQQQMPQQQMPQQQQQMSPQQQNSASAAPSSGGYAQSNNNQQQSNKRSKRRARSQQQGMPQPQYTQQQYSQQHAQQQYSQQQYSQQQYSQQQQYAQAPATALPSLLPQPQRAPGNNNNNNNQARAPQAGGQAQQHTDADVRKCVALMHANGFYGRQRQQGFKGCYWCGLGHQGPWIKCHRFEAAGIPVSAAQVAARAV